MDNENKEIIRNSSQNQSNDGDWQKQGQVQPTITENQAQGQPRPATAMPMQGGAPRQAQQPMQRSAGAPQQGAPMQGQPRPASAMAMQGGAPRQAQGQAQQPMQRSAGAPQQGAPMQGQPRPATAMPMQSGAPRQAPQPMQRSASAPQGAPMQGQPRPASAMPMQSGAPRQAQGQAQQPMQRPAGAPQQGAPMQGQPRPASAMPMQGGAPRQTQQPMQRSAGAPQQGAPMQGHDANANQDSPRQGVVRLFEPEMHDLKQIIRDINTKPNTKTSLYGQCGEVLLAIQTPGLTSQDAINHAIDVAKQIENSMGTFAYARDRKSLPLCTVELLSSKGFKISAPDEETGRLLEQELSTIDIAHNIFDFGEKSYYNSKMANKILDAALLDDEESPDAAQLASDRSYAAKKCMKTTFGVAIAASQDEQEIGIAVTYGKIVYVRRIENSQNSNKAAVLTLMDMLRRLSYGYTIPYAKAFHAGDELDWDDPLEQKGALTRSKSQNSDVKVNSKSGYDKPSEKKGLILPILVLCLVAIALIMGIYYIYNTFIIEDDTALAVGTTNSTSQLEDNGESATAAPLPTSTQQGEATGENSDAVVHPFTP